MSVILSEVKGFTPVIDVVVKDVGLIEAVVYGVVWRYCKREDGVCTASLETIGKQVGISSRTAVRHIKSLCDKGYIEDMTPGVRNRPHVYRDTGKVKIQGLLDAGTTESHTNNEGVTESPSGCDRESDPGMTESQLKILDTKKKEKNASSDGIGPWFLALAGACSINLDAATGRVKGMLKSSAEIMRDKVKATPDDIVGFREWWAGTWRGKGGQAPTIAQLREHWGEYIETTGGDGPLKIGRM